MGINEDAADLLEKAADVIFTKGHCKGDLQNSEGNVCALGALELARKGVRLNQEDITILRDYNYTLKLLRSKVGSGIASWNDAPERTPEEVMNTMKEVAKDLRNKVLSASENNPVKEEV